MANGKLSLITKGFIKENPTFVLVLGMCPTLATTTSAINGLEMGLATMFVLILSNIVISLIAPVVPDKVHIPAYIVVIATFVTVLQLVMQAYTPAAYKTLGLFIPLIVVNCIVLGRAGVELAAQTVCVGGDLQRRAPLGSLEGHMLHEMGETFLGGRFHHGARVHPQPHGYGGKVGERFSNDTQAVGQLPLLLFGCKNEVGLQCTPPGCRISRDVMML